MNKKDTKKPRGFIVPIHGAVYVPDATSVEGAMEKAGLYLRHIDFPEKSASLVELNAIRRCFTGNVTHLEYNVCEEA